MCLPRMLHLLVSTICSSSSDLFQLKSLASINVTGCFVFECRAFLSSLATISCPHTLATHQSIPWQPMKTSTREPATFCKCGPDVRQISFWKASASKKLCKGGTAPRLLDCSCSGAKLGMLGCMPSDSSTWPSTGISTTPEGVNTTQVFSRLMDAARQFPGVSSHSAPA